MLNVGKIHYQNYIVLLEIKITTRDNPLNLVKVKKINSNINVKTQQQSLPYVNGRFELADCNNLELRRLEADYEPVIDLSGYNNRPS